MGERLELLGERGGGGGALLVEGAELGLDLRERLAQRLHQRGDGELAFFQVAVGELAGAAERFLREVEEGGVVGPQGVGGKGLELEGGAGLGVGEGGEFIGRGGAFGGERGAEGGDAGLRDQPGRGAADDKTRE